MSFVLPTESSPSALVVTETNAGYVQFFKPLEISSVLIYISGVKKHRPLTSPEGLAALRVKKILVASQNFLY
jgi:hypothetical protein